MHAKTNAFGPFCTFPKQKLHSILWTGDFSLSLSHSPLSIATQRLAAIMSSGQYDLTSKMIPYLDQHLVFPLLEFLEINEVRTQPSPPELDLGKISGAESGSLMFNQP
jgi:hypothetical protein